MVVGLKWNFFDLLCFAGKGGREFGDWNGGGFLRGSGKGREERRGMKYRGGFFVLWFFGKGRDGYGYGDGDGDRCRIN